VCKYYNGANIVLNVHRSFDDPYLKQNKEMVQADTPNNRLFEIAACASFQLSDHRPDIEMYYQTGTEIITYGDESELKEKITFFLPREQLRKKIAIQAYQRTMKEHLYENRLKQMVQIIFSS
jgi:spore maturation protein CgeB